MSSTMNPSATGDAASVPAGPPDRKAFRRVMAGSMVGAVLEWYDYAIYGVLAATVLGPLFFKGSDPVLQTLLSLATMGIGFVARPVGGLVFGHLGDKFGRQPMLVVTFLMLGASTAAIGFLPTLSSAGVIATVLLVLLRLVQGFALGGEFGAAVLLVSEYGEPKRRGLWASWPQAGAPLGTVLATVVISILRQAFPGDAFLEWGWRAAFWVAVPLLAVGFWIRRGIEESPVFQQAQARADARNELSEKSSLLEALAKPRPILHGLGVRLGENVAFYVYTIFVLSYATTIHHYPQGVVLNVVLFASVAQFFGMIGGGWWSDKVGRKVSMMVPSVTLLIWAPIFFLLVGTHSTPLLALGVIFGAFAHGMLAGPEAAWIAELFPTRYRYAGSSLVFQGSSIIAGAPAPLIALWLAGKWGWQPVAVYLAVTIAVTLVALLTAKETRGRDLNGPNGPYDHAKPEPVDAGVR